MKTLKGSQSNIVAVKLRKLIVCASALLLNVIPFMQRKLEWILVDKKQPTDLMAKIQNN